MLGSGMAQVEIFMYVALGFATATLIALLLGRALWSLAIGIGRRRAQRMAVSPAAAELQAERDRLRAENAMLARRVEVRLGDLKAQVAEQMAEVSRSRNRIDRLGAEIDKRDASLAERDSEIARLKDHNALLEDELAIRTASLHALQVEHAEAAEATAVLRQQQAGRDSEIARLRAEVDRLGAARSEAVSRERTVQERLKGRIADLSALSRQIEEQRRQLVVQQSQSRALRQTMAEQQGAGAGEAERDLENTADKADKAVKAVKEVLPEAEKAEGELSSSAPLERHIEDAERRANQLQSELDRLDEIWAAKLADVAHAVTSEPPAQDAPDSGDAAMIAGDAGKPVAAETERSEMAAEMPLEETAPAEDDRKPAPGLANVISLAQRIRALQRNGS
jgi:chromosome segregation ATPase